LEYQTFSFLGRDKKHEIIWKTIAIPVDRLIEVGCGDSVKGREIKVKWETNEKLFKTIFNYGIAIRIMPGVARYRRAGVFFSLWGRDVYQEWLRVGNKRYGGSGPVFSDCIRKKKTPAPVCRKRLRKDFRGQQIKNRFSATWVQA
jgi:hypothetical protein